jgi:phosphate acetyltransferase
VPTAVVHPCDESSLSGAVDAAKLGLIRPILVGPKAKIDALAKSLKLDIAGYELVDVPHSHAAAAKAVELVRGGKAEAQMKGALHTDELMAEVVKRDTGLRTARRISHCFVMDVPSYATALIISDAAVNIAPTLKDKVDIVQNAIDLAHAALPRGASGDPVGDGNGESRRALDGGGGGAVQDGRPRPDHGRHPRWPACAR